MDLSESWGILKFTVDLIFVTKLRAAGTMLFELDSNLLTIGTDAKVNVTEGSSTNSFGNAVFLRICERSE